MKHAVYACTRNLYGSAVTSAKSLIANSDVGKVWVLSEGDFDYWVPDMVEVVDVSGQEFFPEDGPNMASRYTYMALMRAALALMPELSEVDRILSLDCDVIASRMVSDLWDTDIEGRYFAAVREMHRSIGNMLYCNIGVALFNLDLLRNGKAEEFVYALNNWRYRWPEQDVINYLCQGRIATIPPEYNACDFIEHSVVRIRHFADQPFGRWSRDPMVAKYREMTWDRALELHEGMVRRGR